MTSTNETTDSKELTRLRILKTAADIFQEYGYTGTTTRTIASQSNVAEVTLFRHFGNKEKLFQAVVNEFNSESNLIRIESRFTGNYHTDLLLIGKAILPGLIAQRKTIRLFMFEASHFPEVQKAVTQTPNQLRRILASYFRKQIDKNKVQKLNPDLMAQAFFSMLFGYAIGLDPPHESLLPKVQLKIVVEQFVKFFADGTAITKE